MSLGKDKFPRPGTSFICVNVNEIACPLERYISAEHKLHTYLSLHRGNKSVTKGVIKGQIRVKEYTNQTRHVPLRSPAFTALLQRFWRWRFQVAPARCSWLRFWRTSCIFWNWNSSSIHTHALTLRVCLAVHIGSFFFSVLTIFLKGQFWFSAKFFFVFFAAVFFFY